eukprot:TRINITY_DN12315_c1_g5_i1.p1 TRINITY_DN12315_c1_g5~~TRINITY_DN12315_c1_g5_i1.p1  ORF type:complete len:104 (+),score=10.10 TRINITY_DN12315_c1_g5_i1:544-855(+)
MQFVTKGWSTSRYKSINGLWDLITTDRVDSFSQSLASWYNQFTGGSLPIDSSDQKWEEALVFVFWEEIKDQCSEGISTGQACFISKLKHSIQLPLRPLSSSAV